MVKISPCVGFTDFRAKIAREDSLMTSLKFRVIAALCTLGLGHAAQAGVIVAWNAQPANTTLSSATSSMFMPPLGDAMMSGPLAARSSMMEKYVSRRR